MSLAVVHPFTPAKTKCLRKPTSAQPGATGVAGRVPRITRLMALAIKLDACIRDGLVNDYAELARVGHVSRARITQIMNLTLLAPDIQEALLNLPRTPRGQGRAPIRERHVRPIAAELDWQRQREMWAELQALQNEKPMGQTSSNLINKVGVP